MKILKAILIIIFGIFASIAVGYGEYKLVQQHNNEVLTELDELIVVEGNISAINMVQRNKNRPETTVMIFKVEGYDRVYYTYPSLPHTFKINDGYKNLKVGDAIKFDVLFSPHYENELYLAIVNFYHKGSKIYERNGLIDGGIIMGRKHWLSKSFASSITYGMMIPVIIFAIFMSIALKPFNKRN